ncbi:N-acetylmuramoyl-L-alanine amidase [Streptacidiphilus cavernicola]|uniref:N-acetylmuramoyl-L-alanine amidase n=1 Tax=Streptacidiphilus cavernicola TaxID=3342716 RepID=A0ABV6VVK8_9ACTN
MTAARHGRKKSRIWAGAAAALVASALVVGAVAEAATGGDSAAAKTADGAYTLQGEFTAAAAEFHVPASVLLAVSYQETLWESHGGQPSSTGNYNVMGLTQVTPTDLNPVSKAEKLADLNAFGDGRKHHEPSAAVLAKVDTVDTTVPALHTLDAASGLLKVSGSELRTSTKQSVRGGAALLASYEKKLHGSLPTDAGSWYAAVAEYDQATDSATAQQFATRVFDTIRTGAARTTNDGQVVTLDATPAVAPQTTQLRSLALAPAAAGTATANAAAATPKPSCPSGMACTFVPANADNYDAANRPADNDAIRDIVIHDTEASASSTINTFQQDVGLSAHYVISATGAVTQMVPLTDTGIHADNKTINMHSIGVEHEGYALKNGSWFSVQEYETSAQLVKYLAGLYNIPLDRDHVIGHDEVPYVFNDPSLGKDNPVVSQHFDPGTYWDWRYYLGLLGAPISGNGQAVVGGTVTIAPPDTSANEPVVTGCVTSTATCTAHPTNFVYLRTSASASAPLIGDALLKSVGMSSGSTNGGDVSDKADYGQTFVVAGVSGDWTAIWFGGQKAWFYNPGGVNAYANSSASPTLVTPAGSAAVQVYGRTYPEQGAYPASQAAFGATAGQGIDYKKLPYTIPVGQAYTALTTQIPGDYYQYNGVYTASDTTCAAAADQCMITGSTMYYQIRYNHRIGYVKASDVTTVAAATPPTGTYVSAGPQRILDTRSGLGAPKAVVGPGKHVTLKIAGANGLPASGVTSVVLNVTVTNPTATGYVSVYPDGQSLPTVSNLNFTAKETIPNLVTVPVGADGSVDLYNRAGTVNLLADLNGYYTNGGGGSKLVSTSPARILDTRSGLGAPKAVVGPGKHVTLKIAGANGLPASGVTAVVLNVTVTNPTLASYVSVYPDGQSPPTVSNLNFTAKETIPNLVIVPVGSDGSVDLYNYRGNADLLADLNGYFTNTGSGSVFHTAGPVRVMDTRSGLGVRKGAVGAGATVTLPVGAANGVPLNATAVVLNVTATVPTSSGFVTVYPNGSSLPQVSNLNFSKGETIPNLVVVRVVNGKVNFTNKAGSVQLIADLTGYYTG